MKPVIILYKSIPDDQLERLNQHFSVTFIDGLTQENKRRYAAQLKQALGIIGANSGGKVDESLLALMPQLRVASTISVGYDNFALEALTRRKIALMHTPAVPAESVADTAMALVLAVGRRLVEMTERVKAGEWRQVTGPEWFGHEVHHKTLGIVGMGRIGCAIALRAGLGFNMPVLYSDYQHNAYAERDLHARYCELDELLAQADYLCIAVPLTDETYHLIDKTQFARMKKSAVIINIGRGPVINEAALIDALRAGEIRAAGLDVFEHEPLAMDSPLLTMNNVVASPHIGSTTHETRHAMAVCAVDNLIAVLDGQGQSVAKNCVNPAVL